MTEAAPASWSDQYWMILGALLTLMGMGWVAGTIVWKVFGYTDTLERPHTRRMLVGIVALLMVKVAITLVAWIAGL